jgi:hypothetical protein
MDAKIGKVKMPVFAIVAAIPKAVKAAKVVGADNRDASSPGGKKVTAGEVAEVVAAFLVALGAEVTDDILEANGLPKQVR